MPVDDASVESSSETPPREPLDDLDGECCRNRHNRVEIVDRRPNRAKEARNVAITVQEQPLALGRRRSDRLERIIACRRRRCQVLERQRIDTMLILDEAIEVVRCLAERVPSGLERPNEMVSQKNADRHVVLDPRHSQARRSEVGQHHAVQTLEMRIRC